ncbi:MAG: hypothetical protein ABSH37_16230 [Bryobacteraceae bacterium]|jgi:hypothetical protein
MYLFDLFRSFLPLHNPIGFGAADFIEFALAAMLVLMVALRGRVEPAARRLADSAVWSMLFLALLPIALRLALLPRFPVPTPGGADDFSYLLLGDTLAHLRLANPAHPLHQFFEAVFILQQPTYSSIFPLGQGVVLALGQLFGHPWVGVALSVGALSAGCYWMLRGWTSAGWALVGGVLAAFEFGPLSQWMNLYWGGAVSGVAGCLVCGALPRLRRAPTTRNAALVGAGLGLQLLTRPFEFVPLAIAAAVFLLPGWRRFLEALPIIGVTLLPAVSLTLAQNKVVTGSWTTLPYMLSRYQYGVPTTFTFQPNPVPHVALTPEQDLDYRAQSIVHGQATDTPANYLARLGERLHFYRFFFCPPLIVALPAFLAAIAMRRRRLLWVAGAILLFALADNFYPYFYPHYIAALTCVFVLASVTALEFLSRWQAGRAAARLAVFLAVAHFLFWYAMLCGNQTMLLAAGRFDTADFINYGDPEGRIRIDDQLASLAGRHLVFVRYGPQHMFHEWIHNAADIDAADVVWAADLGDTENQKLVEYYPTRRVWLVEPDARPPQIAPYP